MIFACAQRMDEKERKKVGKLMFYCEDNNVVSV